jgi:flagellar FliJ protein
MRPIQHVADMRETEAMRSLALCQQQAAEQEARLQEMQNYIHEYANAVPQTATPALLGNRHAFLARLREAEAFQLRALEQARARCEVERARWLLKRRDTGTLEQLAASYRAQERVHAERRSQKDLDEIAMRRVLERVGDLSGCSE